MIRTLTGIALGPLLASVLLLALEAWIAGLYPLPAGRDPHDPAVIGAWIAGLPFQILALWLIGWVVAAALAVVLATAVSGRGWAGLISGLLLLAPAALIVLVLLDSGFLAGALLVTPAAGAAFGVLLASSLVFPANHSESSSELESAW